MNALRLSILTVFLFTVFAAHAQLRADFSLDRSAGCSPLHISFTNTSAGITSNTRFLWEFGNGNSSSLKDPAAIFTEEKVYTVKLTLTDGPLSSTISKQVTVYRKPEVDFSASLTKGCVPLSVGFSTSVKPGDGSVSTYFWDLGDGISSSTTAPTYAHTYQTSQLSTVSLTVTNSYGCYTTVEKKELVNVLPRLLSDFRPETNFLCRVGDELKLQNLSSGPGALSYSWDFGDGQTSTEKDPVHRFNTSGAFTVKLKVDNADGCSVTETKTNILNVANFKSDFNLPDVICPATNYTFSNKSFPKPDTYKWYVNGVEFWQWQVGDMNISFQTGKNRITLVNTFGSCIDSVVKEFEVRAAPKLEGFVMELVDRCKNPVEYRFRDTSQAAVQWLWTSDWGNTGTAKEVVIPFYTNGQHSVSLMIKDVYGCYATTWAPVQVRRPDAVITSADFAISGTLKVCGSGNRKLELITQENIVKYEWSSGSGLTSSDPSPSFLYNKHGDYIPSVKLTTDDGCVFTVTMPWGVAVRDSAKLDFSVPQVVCGNTPVLIKNTSVISPNANSRDYATAYDLGDGNRMTVVGSGFGDFYYKFKDTGIYTISMTMTDLVCFDTLVKTNHVRVLPPLPTIKGFTRTCEGTRGSITLDYESKYVVSGQWDFGDGTNAVLDPAGSSIQHTYTKTGLYKVVLTTTNGVCTVKDSIMVSVLLKQSPLLSSAWTEVCYREDYFKLSISNLDPIPAPDYYNNYNTYNIQAKDGKWLGSENDLEIVNGVYNWRRWNFFETNMSGEVRILVFNSLTGCPDTTNWIPLKVKGPNAVINEVPQICPTGNIVNFIDSSWSSGNAKVVRRDWYLYPNMYDIAVTTTTSQPVSYKSEFGYAFPVKVKVTDSDGCTAFADKVFYPVNNQLKASFQQPPAQVSPGTTISFNNTSITSDPGNTTYAWTFGDGSSSALSSPSKTFTTPGTYQVMLVAQNTLRGCTDTARVTITVKYVNAAFSFKTQFLTNANCLPAWVQFNNTSSNVARIFWDFGDGVTSEQFNPSHLYTKAGTYVITQKTFSDNGTMYQKTDTIKILAPTLSFSADSISGCTNQLTKFRASTTGVQRFIWDAGDGTVATSNADSVYAHNYRTAGVFNPRILVTDANGCQMAMALNDSVRIDSLGLALLNLPAQICAPKTLQLKAEAITAVKGQALTYAWTAGAETASSSDPSFNFNNAGTYPVQLTVTTQYGCVRTITRELKAFQGLGGIMNGPAEVCVGTAARFTGATQIAGTPQWQWTFPDGSASALKDPSAYTFAQTGTFPVRLVVLNNGCNDTITRNVIVHPNPSNILAQRTATLCDGAAVELRAGGAASYKWTPSAGLLSDTGTVVMAAPANSITYLVTATSSKGCVGKDSVRVALVRKQQLQLPAELSFCSGQAVQIKASGTDKYQWVGNTSGLSSTTVSSPTARPLGNTSYTVVGSDAQNCFTDTAQVSVVLLPQPTVDAGPGAELSVGASFTLQPTVSNDVQRYQWQPEKYLSCTTCPTPVATPMENTRYTLTVTNDKGCSAVDTVTINVLCQESRIFIPNIFTPNGDGKNDLFMIGGQGIKLVKSLKIYDRFGTAIFERSSFQVNDPGAAWNGKVKGMLVPAGAYVYMAELSCDEKTFIKKGTITVVY